MSRIWSRRFRPLLGDSLLFRWTPLIRRTKISSVTLGLSPKSLAGYSDILSNSLLVQ